MGLVELTSGGDRLLMLKRLAVLLAKKIEAGEDEKALAQIAKQYRETIREIQKIEGVGNAEDEIGNILSARDAAGKPGAVRKDRA